MKMVRHKDIKRKFERPSEILVNYCSIHFLFKYKLYLNPKYKGMTGDSRLLHRPLYPATLHPCRWSSQQPPFQGHRQARLFYITAYPDGCFTRTARELKWSPRPVKLAGLSTTRALLECHVTGEKEEKRKRRGREKGKIKKKKTVGLPAWKKREVFCLRGGNEY